MNVNAQRSAGSMKQVSFKDVGKKSDGWQTEQERMANETFDLGSSASFSTRGTNMSNLREMRKTTLLREGKKFEEPNELGYFDQQTLRDRLQLSIPLQKLYERMYFDNWNPAEEIAKHDRSGSGEVLAADFERIIEAGVSSLDKATGEVK